VCAAVKIVKFNPDKPQGLDSVSLSVYARTYYGHQMGIQLMIGFVGRPHRRLDDV
jgi:hypothetical protein